MFYKLFKNKIQHNFPKCSHRPIMDPTVLAARLCCAVMSLAQPAVSRAVTFTLYVFCLVLLIILKADFTF